MLLDCRFDQPQLAAGLNWFNPPPQWQLQQGLQLPLAPIPICGNAPITAFAAMMATLC